jgi:DNA-directed RNA polymerase subunit M/transcription elongation factor TFIIS
MLFCPNCNNILNISKSSQVKPKVETEPETISSSESDTNNSTIINKLLNNETLTDEEIKNIDKKEIQKDEEFIKLDKKKKSILNKKITELSNPTIDESLKAFYVCKNCGFSKEIPNDTLIISKADLENTSETRINTERFKNMIYSKILPHTRAYICPNKDCPCHKNNTLREAVFYRPTQSLQTWYTCMACQSYWIGN